MTHSAGGYSPPQTDSLTEPQSGQSTSQVAKDEAAGVAQTAAQAGSQVGGTAGEQAKRVVQETTQQARDLVAEGRGQLRQQAKQGQQKAADSLHALADQLHQMSEKTDEGLAPELARQAAERARSVATWIGDREPGALIDEVRSFARRKPGLFLAGAAIAGVLAGRLTRGAVAAAHDSGTSGTPTSGTRNGLAYEPPTTPMPSPVPRDATLPPPAPAFGTGAMSEPAALPPEPGYPDPTFRESGYQDPGYRVAPSQPGSFPGQQGPVTR